MRLVFVLPRKVYAVPYKEFMEKLGFDRLETLAAVSYDQKTDEIEIITDSLPVHPPQEAEENKK